MYFYYMYILLIKRRRFAPHSTLDLMPSLQARGTRDCNKCIKFKKGAINCCYEKKNFFPSTNVYKSDLKVLLEINILLLVWKHELFGFIWWKNTFNFFWLLLDLRAKTDLMLTIFTRRFAKFKQNIWSELQKIIKF